MKRSTKIGIGAVTAILIAGGTTFAVVRSKDRKLVEVTTAKVERVDLSSKVSANGNIEAKRKVDLSANVMGQIVNLAVREGDRVRKGDFLLQIDKAQLAASAAGAEASLKSFFSEREAARANLTEAQRNHARAQRNYRERIIPLAELEATRTALEAAQANLSATSGRIDQARAGLAGARDTLSKTTIRAPMDGVVTRLPVEEGEVAVIGTMNNPGTVLLTISEMSVVEAVMEVDETDIPNVRIGQKATVTVDAYPNKTFEGLVTEVGSSPIERAGALSGSEAINFEVKIQLTNPPSEVRPGFSASADILTGSRPGAVAIPIQALVVREKPGATAKGPSAKTDEEGVYLFDPATQKVVFKTVTTGITGDTMIEVASGLTPGNEIVSGPFRALRDIKDGDKVKLPKEKGKDGKPKDEKAGE